MHSRSVVLCGLGLLFVSASLAAAISCDPSLPNDCMGNFTCQADGTCQGEPVNEGQPCTQNLNPCMTNPVCQQGTCMGTVAAADNSPCNFPGFEKCYSPGHCTTVAGVFSFCTLGTPKTCPPPSNPCQASVCDFTTGNCIVGDACGSFFGCATCDNGTCKAINIGGHCTNPDGDFNECTTDDRCVLLGGRDARSVLPDGIEARLPPDVAAMFQTDQAVPIAICQGVAGGSTPVPSPTPTLMPTATPTTPVGPAPCVGDCNGGGTVTVDEILEMVNIALEIIPGVQTCEAGDADHSQTITVDEILAAVNNALTRCPPAA